MTTLAKLPDATGASGAAGTGSPPHGDEAPDSLRAPVPVHRSVDAFWCDLAFVVICAVIGFLAAMAAYWSLVHLVEPVLYGLGVW